MYFLPQTFMVYNYKFDIDDKDLTSMSDQLHNKLPWIAFPM